MALHDADLNHAAAKAGLGLAAIVVRDLTSATEAALDPDLPLYPASAIKVPLVAAALAEIDAGRLDESRPLPVGPENMTANDAESPLRPGYSASLGELMHRAIARSDNVATNMLFDAVGRARATALVRERFGLTATAFHRKLSGAEPLIDDPHWDGVHRNTHSAADSAQLYAAIAADRIPRAPALRAMLADQIWNEKLSGGLRGGDRFLHKTGDTNEVSHDGGILITQEGRHYVVVVHTGLPTGESTNQRLATFMRMIRRHL